MKKKKIKNIEFCKQFFADQHTNWRRMQKHQI